MSILGGLFARKSVQALLHNPEEILRPFVATGMTVLDIGSAMGFFTLPLARMVGPNGRFWPWIFRENASVSSKTSP
jgi:hypothetical protein